ncbi:MAG: glyoxalase-like domain protein, partial [Moorea sp. SIO3C2]|nr:glyoxalase-like domain protein [Moorena sp. SIO3C2]
TMGSTSIDPLYMSTNLGTTQATQFSGADGLWYQLKKNTQLHVISGASLGNKNQQRHVCFDHECLDQVLMLVQMRRLKYKVRTLKPLNFLVKDVDDRVIELAEVSN